MKISIKILSISFLLLFALNVNAQKIGLQMGVEMTNTLERGIISKSNFQEFITFGPTVDIDLTEKIILSTGLIASYGKNEYYKPITYAAFEGRVKSFRSEIPMLLKFNKNNKNGFHIQAGINLRTVIRSEKVYTFLGRYENSHRSKRKLSSFDRTTLGVQFGIAYEIKAFRFGLDVKTEEVNLSKRIGYDSKVFNISAALSVNYLLVNLVKMKDLYR